MPCGKKRKRHKIATHKRKKRLRKIDIRRRIDKGILGTSNAVFTGMLNKIGMPVNTEKFY